MTATIMPNGKHRFYDLAGNVLSGGKLYTYAAGTVVPKATFSDQAATIPNTNPVILDIRGEALVRWEGSYKYVLKTSADVTIETIDDFTPNAALLDSNGANSVGFLYAAGYSAGTLGKWLQDLALGAGSSFVGIVQSGVGAVIRNLLAKVREIGPSVVDYGAVGDGVTNDTAAFTAAQLAHSFIEVPAGLTCKVNAGLDYWKFYGRGAVAEPGRQWTLPPFPQTGSLTKAYIARTFGILETAVGSSITINSGIAQTKENTQILGTNTVGLAQIYTDRDHVAQYISSYSFTPDVLDATTTYTAVTMTNAAVGALNAAGKIKPGMIVDTRHADICTGIIQSVAGNVITVDAWYARSGGGAMTPATLTGAIINPNNKVFGVNVVVSAVGNGTTTGAQKFTGFELDLGTPASGAAIAGTWGFDMVSTTGSYIDIGFQVRGKRNITYFSNSAGGAGLTGFYSIGDATAFRSDDAQANAWEGRSAGAIVSSISNIGIGKLAKLGVGITVGSSIMDVYAPLALATAAAQFTHEASAQNALALINVAAAGNNKWCNFISDPGYVERGSIDYNRGGGLARFNTTSDATLKTLLGDAPVDVSCRILLETRLREYHWNHDSTKKPQIGPFAQELYETFKGAVKVGRGAYTEIIPEVTEQRLVPQTSYVPGAKPVYETVVVTPEREEERFDPWAVDKTAFTFHLIAGWQEHERQITALEARLTAAGL